MLVLTRKAGEAIVVGDDIEVEILEVRGGVVRVGIKAPRSVRVLRRELIEEVAAANSEASSVQVPDPGAAAALLGRVGQAPVTRPKR